ncbi:MAG: aspartate kinase, partial [Paenibacillus sp. RIFOXYA1_FULL_44_5]
IKEVARRIVERKQEGHQCIVVVSAMGDTTDELIDLSKQIVKGIPSAREMDMLLSTGEQVSTALVSMAIQQLGQQAVSYTGWQAGMYTEAVHGKARITDIQPKRILQALESGHIVVVAGFQGMTDDGEITTLGRGGSDTTAVALAAAVEADLCEFYKDVDGVYSTDPRIVRVARKIDEVTYDEMLELANLGAAVLHPRAVEYAKHYRVPLVVRSSFTYNEGTYIKEEAVMEQGIAVRGIAYDKDVARISILGVKEQPGQLAKVFTALAGANIDVDIIVQSGVREGKADFSFTLSLSDVEKAKSILKEVQSEVEFEDVSWQTGLVKVSIVGAGMVSTPGVAAKMFEVISNLGISINMVSTSEIKMSCVIDHSQLTDVVKGLHTAYGLDTNEQVFVGGRQDRREA